MTSSAARTFGGVRARVRRLLVSVVRSDERIRREIDEELDAHINARIEYLVARGMSPDDARAESLRRFGDLDAGRAYLHAYARDQRRRLELAERMNELQQDIRYVLRGLSRSPAFTAGGVATLALGLGINSAVFRVTDQVLLRPPVGVESPRAIRRVEWSMKVGQSGPLTGVTFSYPDTRAMLGGEAPVAASLYSMRTARLPDGREVSTAAVDSGYFHLLGVRPMIGRAFDASETTPGAGLPVVIVSYDYWQRELGGVPLGDAATVTLGGHLHRVVGVAPRGFIGIDLDPIDVWIAFGAGEFGTTTVNGVIIPWYQSDMGRPLRAIVRLPSASAEGVVLTRLSAGIGGKDKDGGRTARTAILRPIIPAGDSSKIASTVRLLERLSGVAAIILLIACANAANLLLARGLRRRQEIAVRLAMGASRSRIARLLLVESLALGAAGGTAAAIAGYWTGEALRRVLFPGARWTTSAFDQRSLLFTGLLALVAGLAAGAAPAFQLTNPDLVTALKDVRRAGARARRTRTTLVVLQTAFSLVLLVASGLLVRSLQRLNAVDIGFEPEGLVSASMSGGRFFKDQSSIGTLTATQLAERMRLNPRVKDVTLATEPPFGTTSRRSPTVPGTTYVPDDNEAPTWSGVGPNYFTVMRTRIIRGRAFSAADVLGGEAVTVINETMARRYWSGPIPYGACILSSGGPCARIVGIAKDVRDTRSGSGVNMHYYLPLAQTGDSATAVIVRAEPASASAILASMKAAYPPTVRGTSFEIIADRVAQALRPWRIATMLFIGLGAVALTLACVGVYSVMSYIASERVHEMGVRMVLGATAADVRMLVLRDGLRLGQRRRGHRPRGRGRRCDDCSSRCSSACHHSTRSCMAQVFCV